jgi:hypothetical protein
VPRLVNHSTVRQDVCHANFNEISLWHANSCTLIDQAKRIVQTTVASDEGLEGSQMKKDAH